ncbi:TrmH family RNA methyltransferase [Corynebacterium pseudopelargi]|uniref:23S rRNA (Uridine(2479)-2'-O)-methyltransferase n=1 Tax=Corynebacterium pseudopelargi TaxID=2080757 RepID=A0A3G6IUK9_9CORY|nr:RNA methyltransferase [Corynebacterium pseudopelargi]AZA09372.1 23S rRNA (uridine(2479)-2'-O)-methyltransferase [Corynebacterium pseudopelargi]
MASIDFSDPFTERTPRVVQAAKLHRSAARKKAQKFIVEGENSVEAALATGSATDLFITEQAATRFGHILTLAQNMGVYIHPINNRAAAHMSDTKTTTGLFAICNPVLWPLKQALRGTPQLLSIPVETNEPGNAGTLIRVADAMGADALVFAGETVDPQSSKCVRASAGSLFHLPVARESNIEAVLQSVRARGMQVLATSADGEVDLDDAEELLAKPIAWLFGNEAHGLGSELLQQADHRVRIPIRGRAESLNLATAASICLYESSKVLHAGSSKS